ncbi:MAG: PGAP1 family protein [Candidatus Moranbacteria bacterium GW2011_GWC1_45_18]|nr:MAG: putative acetyltransferases and hydrolases with the alpha/beta hydrolase fold protein [Candidatus Moranbacteria bacterium GW2011_GWC2_40_12]KKU00168.1 MAG: PGAP1 family protein [Candidatus Moranbacteria bacterium GW2011_GWC1_45_18]
MIIALALAGTLFFAFPRNIFAKVELGSGDPIPPVWSKSDSPYVIKNTIQAASPVTIEPGVVVKFKYAASATFLDSITAIGTEKERIVFTAWTDDENGGDTDGDLGSHPPQKGYWYRILIGSSAKAQFENTSFLYGGEHPWGTLSFDSASKNSVSVRNSAFKHNQYAGIYINYNPDQIIENNTFLDNGEGIVLNDCYHGLSATISGNSFEKNANFGVRVAYPSYNTLDARNNWWGDRSGPYQSTKNPSGKGDKISNGVLFDPWIGKGGFVPVVVVPGVMASWEKDGEWQIDPIFHTYDNLLEEFKNEGYIPEKELFTFPYEWRDSNVSNAVKLKDKIQEIKNQTGFPKVDIVAHSMGGLLARQYIESDDYQDDVRQLITVATPHLGAPKVYVKWEAGAFFSDIFETVGKYIFEQEAKENGYGSVFHYIRDRIASVKELLPVYDYLWDDNGTDYDLRVGYPENYPRNEFLENLNSAEKVKKLENVEFTKIIGKPEGAKTTISGYNVVDADIRELWEHGYPHGFEISKLGDQGINKDYGDETVPLYSAESSNIPNNKTLYFESEHNIIPTDAQRDILQILTGKKPENEVKNWVIDDILIGLVFSPVDIQIVSPSGKRLGKNFETGGEYGEIEGAYYSGFKNDTEFFTIPNPEDGEYKIFAQGTGEGGSYKIEVAEISENPADPDNAKESSVVIEDEAQAGKTREAKVEVTEDQIRYNPDKTPPTITVSSPEKKDYTNDEILAIDYEVQDPESGVASNVWQVEKDGQNVGWQKNAVDLSFEHLGNYVLRINAADNAGNSIEKEANFQVVTSLEAIRNNLNHYFSLGLIKKKVAHKYFDAKFRNLEKLLSLLKKAENSNLKPKPKQEVVASLEKKISKSISVIIRQINRKTPQWIDPKAANFLIEDLNYIRNN